MCGGEDILTQFGLRAKEDGKRGNHKAMVEFFDFIFE